MPAESRPNELTALIVDDEFHGRENLKKIIETYCPEIKVLECADSVVGAIKLVKELQPEVVFLDINMPGLDGFDFLEEYIDRNFMVVFVSAYEEFGIKAVKAGVVDYLLKPINIKELKQTVKRLISIKNSGVKPEPVQELDKLVLPASHGFNVLVMDDIIRLEAEGCYTKVIVKTGKDTIISRTLKDFEDSLPREKFFRIHKSHIINFKYIKDYSNIDGYSLTMTDGSKLDISRRRAPDFIKKIRTVMKTV
jgi:two-component system LytT family response regulator